MRGLIAALVLAGGPALACAPYCPPPPPQSDVVVWGPGGAVIHRGGPGHDFSGWDMHGARERELERQDDLGRDVDWWDDDED